VVTIYLKKGRDKPVRTGNPWIFSGAVARVEGAASAGEACAVVSSGGEVLGSGYYNPASSICVRMLSPGTTSFSVNDLKLRIDRALKLRGPLLENPTTNAYRLVNSEGDFLPGLIVDRYAEGLCVQVLTAGMERFRDDFVSYLQSTLSPSYIYERSDTDARKREGLRPREGLLSGAMPESPVVIENGLRFCVDLAQGQKTGLFLDQRCNRKLFGTYAKNAAVCDCFAYTGGFTVSALASGAKSVRTVDISKSALSCARKNTELNGLPCVNEHFIAADVFTYLRETSEVYDLIVLDPPKFARHPGEVAKAARGYKDINLQAFKKAARDAIIFTFSCSNAIDGTLFRQIVFSAAADSGRSVQALHALGAGPDHPVNIAHYEGDYLKGLALRVG
jgi:23S rRNA (cytosine1962-C5)-methyltransferase